MPSTARRNPQRVLLVDDHPRLRSLIGQALREKLPAEVVESADIPTALDVLSRGTFTAVVSDVNLPGTSGLVALPSLRAAIPDGRLVLISATSTPGLAGAARDAGADAFVAKSSGFPALCRAIDPTWSP